MAFFRKKRKGTVKSNIKVADVQVVTSEKKDEDSEEDDDDAMLT